MESPSSLRAQVVRQVRGTFILASADPRASATAGSHKLLFPLSFLCYQHGAFPTDQAQSQGASRSRRIMPAPPPSPELPSTSECPWGWSWGRYGLRFRLSGFRARRVTAIRCARMDRPGKCARRRFSGRSSAVWLGVLVTRTRDGAGVCRSAGSNGWADATASTESATVWFTVSGVRGGIMAMPTCPPLLVRLGRRRACRWSFIRRLAANIRIVDMSGTRSLKLNAAGGMLVHDTSNTMAPRSRDGGC